MQAWSASAQIEFLTDHDIRVRLPDGAHATVVLTLENNRVAVLPAMHNFMTGLTLERGELVDVTYEPTPGALLWPEFQMQALSLRALRALAAATADGVFRLEGPDALAVAIKMQRSKTVDPAMAIYAVHAYEGLGRLQRIRETSHYMTEQHGARFFDIALLAREISGPVGPDPKLLSFVPLLAQGWSLLSARDISLPPALAGLGRFLLPSLWTLFSTEGGRRICDALRQGDVL